MTYELQCLQSENDFKKLRWIEKKREDQMKTQVCHTSTPTHCRCECTKRHNAYPAEQITSISLPPLVTGLWICDVVVV